LECNEWRLLFGVVVIGGGFRCLAALNPAILTVDAETAAAIIRVTGGNFRLLDRLLTQMDRIMRINNLAQVTKGVVNRQGKMSRCTKLGDYG
jgi:hypothetical protein